tara:strand:- start:675 stop:887 length:213 start_codon:yes stop_codon:yes gene_type:complete
MSDNQHYINEIHSIHESYGELHLAHNNGHLVFNINGLYDSLPYVIELCVKSENKRSKDILKEIKNATKDL